MRYILRLFMLVFCAVILASCDLSSRISDAAGGNNGAGSNLYGADASAQYGNDVGAQYGNAGGGAQTENLYGGPATEYAGANDYIMPRQNENNAKSVPPPQVAPQNQGAPKGDELSQKISDIKNDNINPPPPARPTLILPPSVAEPDDVLLVPAKVAKADKKVEIIAPAQSEIIVERGDTVYGLSRKYNVPLRDLLDANNLKPPYAISPGQRLRLPSARVHTVVAGDTLYSISRSYSVDLNSLANENNIAPPYGLVVGQKLRLPASITPQGVAMQNKGLIVTSKDDVKPSSAPQVVKPTATPQPAKPSTAPTAAKPTATPAPVAKPQPQKITSTTASGTVEKLPAAAGRTSTKFSWPVQGKIISDFGAKKNGLYNDGINISAKLGTTVRAAENGVVAYAGNELKGMGNLVIIQHSGGWMTVYAHLDTMNVRRGAKVSVGEKIGTVGETGKVSEPQLHFEIRNGTKAYNPRTQLK